MRKLGLAVVGILLVGLLKLSATVIVNFENPESYKDIVVGGGGNERGQKVILPDIEKYLIRLGKQYLMEGQSLEITFVDIDLAGELEPWRMSSADEIRMMKSVYPPRLKFSFTLTNGDGSVSSSGIETLIDLGYDFHARINTSDRIFYEKKMLKDWFRKLNS